jgi:hypothetical protein
MENQNEIQAKFVEHELRMITQDYERKKREMIEISSLPIIDHMRLEYLRSKLKELKVQIFILRIELARLLPRQYPFHTRNALR